MHGIMVVGYSVSGLQLGVAVQGGKRRNSFSRLTPPYPLCKPSDKGGLRYGGAEKNFLFKKLARCSQSQEKT